MMYDTKSWPRWITAMCGLFIASQIPPVIIASIVYNVNSGYQTADFFLLLMIIELIQLAVIIVISGVIIGSKKIYSLCGYGNELPASYYNNPNESTHLVYPHNP